MDRKTILVTGSSGFLGSNLIKALNHHNVIKVDLSKTDTETLALDVASESFLKQMRFYDIDVIYHLGSACSVLLFHENPVYFTQNTILGFCNIVKLAVKNNAKIIFPSSGNIYGKTEVQSEDVIPKPTNLYASCKFMCETIAKLNSLDFIGLRIFAGYGPGEEKKGRLASVISHFLTKMIQGKQPVVWGDGTQTRDFVYVDDVIEAMVRSMTLDGHEIINIGTSRSTSFNEAVRITNRVIDTHLDPIYIEKPLDYVENTRADIKKMRTLLKIDPLSLEDGIGRYFEYLKKEKGVGNA